MKTKMNLTKKMMVEVAGTDCDFPIFVFGSNLEGRHKRGSAKDALLRWGAILWQGEGLQNQSYALPTKKAWNINMPLEDVLKHIEKFVNFARKRSDLTFLVTRIGTNLAGFTDDQIANLFVMLGPLPKNCHFDPAWRQYGLHSWEKSPNELRPEQPEIEETLFTQFYPEG